MGKAGGTFNLRESDGGRVSQGYIGKKECTGILQGKFSRGIVKPVVRLSNGICDIKLRGQDRYYNVDQPRKLHHVNVDQSPSICLLGMRGDA